jgi:hypothetical protein
MKPLHPKFTFILVFLLLSLTACQANLITATPAPSPSPVTPATPTLNQPTETTASQIPTVLPTPTATQNVSQKLASLENQLISGVDWYILIQSANSGEIQYEQNANMPFPPASMIKIPTAMAVLSILEDQGRTLEDLKTMGINGRNFDALLEAMVVRSEESATDALEYFARGDNQLRKKLDGWGLTGTKYDPRTSTASELLTSLRLLNTGAALNEENTQYLLDLMGVLTENDQILLGKLKEQLPDCQFLNKRGTMLSPTIVSDMGILNCGERSWYLVVAGTPAVNSTATFETIQASIESFAIAFASMVR